MAISINDLPSDERDPETFLGHFSRSVPHKLIVPARDLLDQFHLDLAGDSLPTRELNELLMQIVAVLLNSDEHASEIGLAQLPDVNRITSVGVLHKLRYATPRLAFALRARLVEFGAYQEGDFPYFFDDMLGQDLILTHLPH